MNEKRYIIHFQHGKQFNAGSKAVDDIETISLQNGYELLDYFCGCSRLPILRKLQNLKMLLKFLLIPRNSILLVQFPMYTDRPYVEQLRWIKNRRGTKLILLIHDLNTLRSGEANAKNAEEEAMLKCADCVIVHTDKMRDYLKEKYAISQEQIITLGVFDYLFAGEIEPDVNMVNDNTLVIAGNLSKSKSGYIYKLLRYHFSYLTINLFGANLDEGEKNDKAIIDTYRGAYPPDVLPSVLKGRFGIVWDGDCLETCAGPSGRYLAYNCPHKLSLYIAAEIPVIVWKESAMAQFVLENNVGIAVDSLTDLEKHIRWINGEQYRAMKENAAALGKKLRIGEFFSSALSAAEKVVECSS